VIIVGEKSAHRIENVTCSQLDTVLKFVSEQGNRSQNTTTDIRLSVRTINFSRQDPSLPASPHIPASHGPFPPHPTPLPPPPPPLFPSNRLHPPLQMLLQSKRYSGIPILAINTNPETRNPPPPYFHIPCSDHPYTFSVRFQGVVYVLAFVYLDTRSSMGCSRRDQHTEMLGWRWVREREGRGGGGGGGLRQMGVRWRRERTSRGTG